MRMCKAIKSTVQLFMRSHKNMHHPSVLWEKLGTASSVLMFLKGKHPYNFNSQSNTIRLLSNFGHRKKEGKQNSLITLQSVCSWTRMVLFLHAQMRMGMTQNFAGVPQRWGGILGLVCIMATLIAASLAFRVATDVGQ